ncbi:MAG: class I SAM-dependent methyltransferase [Oscillospiraceae bacterium]|nr:class I SAM-dependent methyltransferase [Oscillospiraceae bacterium]
MSYGVFARFYDRLQEADYEEIGGYYHRLLQENAVKTGAILLDLACGTGRLSRYFADLDYDVIGADISPEMLSIAAGTPCKNIQYLCQDMCSLDLFGTIDCCVCALDGLNHLQNAAAVQRAFERVGLFMNRGGVFVFDMNTLHKHNQILSGNSFIYDLENLYCVWNNSVAEGGRIDMSLDIFARENSMGNMWQKYTERLAETAYDAAKVAEMLEVAGFGGVKIYDWLSDYPANELSEKAVFLAIKM